MTDEFAFFGLPRRPRIDEEALKEKYLKLAAQLHPDASAGDADKFSQLQQGYKMLLDPVARLAHLVALEYPDFQRSTVSTQFPELFMQVGIAVQNGRVLVEKRRGATSPLARAVLTKAIADGLSGLRAALDQVRQKLAQSLDRLGDLDARWPEIGPAELGDLISRLTFLARWERELAEGEFQLANG